MLLEKRRLKTIVVIMTAFLFPLLPYTLYRVYQYQIKVNRDQLQLNTLKDQVKDLDETLSLTASSFIFHQDNIWFQHYQSLQQKFTASLSQIESLVPDTDDQIMKLIQTHDQLLNMEQRSFSLKASGQIDSVKANLMNAAYRQQQALFSSELKKLTLRLDNASNQKFQLLQSIAVKNMMFRASVGILLLGAWIGFWYKNRKWKREINRLKEQKAEEAISTAKELKRLNGQLRQLSKHLEEVREQERLSLAHEINEQIGQQIAVIRIRMASLCANQGGSHAETDLQEISLQLDQVLYDLRKLAAEVYPLILRDLGLVEALQWESEQVSRDSGVSVQFFSEMEEVAVDQKSAAALFQSYREKLHSTIGSGATKVESRLRIEGGSVILEVMHNSKLNELKTVGLIQEMAIQERLCNIQGHWRINTLPNESCSFTMTIPITAS